MYVYVNSRFRVVYERADGSRYFMLDRKRVNVGRHAIYEERTTCSKRKAACEQTNKCAWKKGKGCRREASRPAGPQASQAAGGIAEEIAAEAARVNNLMSSLANQYHKQQHALEELNRGQKVLRQQQADISKMEKRLRQLEGKK